MFNRKWRSWLKFICSKWARLKGQSSHLVLLRKQRLKNTTSAPLHSLTSAFNHSISLSCQTLNKGREGQLIRKRKEKRYITLFFTFPLPHNGNCFLKSVFPIFTKKKSLWKFWKPSTFWSLGQIYRGTKVLLFSGIYGQYVIVSPAEKYPFTWLCSGDLSDWFSKRWLTSARYL